MNKLFKIFLMAIAFFSLSALPDDFKSQSVLDGKAVIKWKIEGENIHIIFGAKNKGKGWVGIGFNDSKTMTDGDFVVGFVKGKKEKVREHWGKSASRHDEKPGKGDVISKKVYVEGDMTMIDFVRPFKGKNKKTKELTKNGDNKIMISYGTSARFSKKHDLKEVAYFSLNFATGAYKNLN